MAVPLSAIAELLALAANHPMPFRSLTNSRSTRQRLYPFHFRSAEPCHPRERLAHRRPEPWWQQIVEFFASEIISRPATRRYLATK
ncbi:MAG: DUF3156 family protein [Defluviicoccus sp.]|nr:MAG: DUF3156 family protein [Defluviicoccus sp.]